MKELTEVENKNIIRMLKEGNTLVSYTNKSPSYFRYKNNKLFVVGNNSSFYISLEDFESLYFNSRFYLYEDDNEDAIDPERDNEYYSWGKLAK